MRIESSEQFAALQAQAMEREKRHAKKVLVCCGTGCLATGAKQVAEAVADEIGQRGLDVDINLGVGYVNERTIPYAAIQDAFRAVLAQEPEHAEALNYLGYMFAEHGVNLDEAVELLERAVALAPENGRAYYLLGIAYDKKGATNAAREA